MGTFLPEQTKAVTLLDRLLHHRVIVITDGESLRMKEARQKGGRSTLAQDLNIRSEGWGLLVATSGDFKLATDKAGGSRCLGAHLLEAW